MYLSRVASFSTIILGDSYSFTCYWKVFLGKNVCIDHSSLHSCFQNPWRWSFCYTMLPFVHQGAIRTKKNSQWDWSSDFDSRGLMGLLFIFTMVTILVRAIDTNTQSFNQQFFIEHCLFSRYSVLFWEYKYSSPKEFTMKKTHKEVIAIHCCIHVYVYIKQAGKDVREKHLSAVWSTVRKVRGCQG